MAGARGALNQKTGEGQETSTRGGFAQVQSEGQKMGARGGLDRITAEGQETSTRGGFAQVQSGSQ